MDKQKSIQVLQAYATGLAAQSLAHKVQGKVFAARGTFGDAIKWNFTKFLIDREGNVVARFEPIVDMKEVRKAVEAAL